jgi:hypothetical protein
VEKLRGFDLHTPLDERYNTNRALIHLAQDFIYSSCSYGRIIISEGTFKVPLPSLLMIS